MDFNCLLFDRKCGLSRSAAEVGNKPAYRTIKGYSYEAVLLPDAGHRTAAPELKLCHFVRFFVSGRDLKNTLSIMSSTWRSIYTGVAKLSGDLKQSYCGELRGSEFRVGFIG